MPSPNYTVHHGIHVMNLNLAWEGGDFLKKKKKDIDALTEKTF